MTSYFHSSTFRHQHNMFVRCIVRVPHLYRGLATHAGPAVAVPASLHLKTGQSFHGKSFGAPRSIFGETVFSTSITSCMCAGAHLPPPHAHMTIHRHRVHDRPILSGSNLGVYDTNDWQLWRAFQHCPL